MRELLREQERQGVSLKAFAESAGIPYTTMSWWRSRLAHEDVPRFVPVRVREESTGVEIVVGDVVVRVPAGAEAAATARLVRAIASC
jgi:hypothetical protein